MSNHLVLLGDSILDNAAYVPGRPAVVDQVRNRLPPGWRATLLARDGSVINDVHRQLERLPLTPATSSSAPGGTTFSARSGSCRRPSGPWARVCGSWRASGTGSSATTDG